MEKKRLFAGIPASKRISHLLFSSVEEFSDQARVVPKNNYHITLSFFGDTDVSQTEHIQSVLHNAQKTSRFSLAFEKLILAPPIGRKRMLWAKYESSDPFNHLVSFIESQTEQYLTQEDTRNGHAPIPHITLVRFQDQSLKKLLIEATAKHHEIEVREILLFETPTSSKEPDYSVVSRHPLSY